MFTNTVHVFDFDGVLARPYTTPELLFPGTERLLRKLSQEAGHCVMVASFNPRAYEIMRPLMEEGIVAHVRAGCNDQQWWLAEHGGVYSDERHRRNLSKAAMIRHLLDAVSNGASDVRFYDDDPDNIAHVEAALPEVRCFHVADWTRGLVPYYEKWFNFRI